MERYEIVTTDGVFLALRYSADDAERARRQFEDRWPQGVIVRPVERHVLRDDGHTSRY